MALYNVRCKSCTTVLGQQELPEAPENGYIVGTNICDDDLATEQEAAAPALPDMV